MVAYIDEFKDRFRVGPIRRALAAPLDCGFITPRGYRMFKSRPVKPRGCLIVCVWDHLIERKRSW